MRLPTALVLLVLALPSSAAPPSITVARREFTEALRRVDARLPGDPAAARRLLATAVETLWAASDREMRSARNPADRSALALARDAYLAKHLAKRPPPDRFTGRRDLTPDLTQTDPRAGLPRGGRDSCGPVAMSDALLALAACGRPSLAPANPDPHAAHARLARILASPDHMDTKTAGTGLTGMLRGATRYARSRGLEVSRAHALGWRATGREWRSDSTEPLLDQIRRAHVTGAAVCLNIGWYRDGTTSDTWTRFGGHWVTVAGYGVDAHDRPAPDVLILRDPAPRSGRKPSFQHATVHTATVGRLEGGYRGLPRPADDIPRITEGLAFRRGATACFVDGAVILDVRPQTKR